MREEEANLDLQDSIITGNPQFMTIREPRTSVTTQHDYKSRHSCDWT